MHEPPILQCARPATTLTTCQGLVLSDIDQVVELGQLGRAAGSSQSTFYMHTQASATDVTGAFSDAAAASGGTAAVSAASGSNPGVPPSSLFTFLAVSPTIQGMVLTEFDTAFINPYYHSELDDTASAAAVARAAALTARALDALARGSTAVSSSPLAVDDAANLEYVSQLLGCLTAAAPGMGCDLVTSLMAPRSTGQLPLYANVLSYTSCYTNTPESPFDKADVSR